MGTTIARYKSILGDHLHARKLASQQAEAAIVVTVLSRIIDAGCLGSVRIT